MPNLKVEVKAIPIDKKDDDQGLSVRRAREVDVVTFQAPLDVPYELTIKDKMCYHSVTVMKAYENYSFEELRYMSPNNKRTSENMLVRPYNDGTYSATWTPASTGWYSVLVTVDGYPLDEVSSVRPFSDYIMHDSVNFNSFS